MEKKSRGREEEGGEEGEREGGEEGERERGTEGREEREGREGVEGST